jgi:hypothetical protein
MRMRTSLLASLLLGVAARATAAPSESGVLSNTALPPLLRGVAYQACDAGGIAFRTTGGTLGEDGVLRFALEGPAASQAMVTARRTPLRNGFRLDWAIAYAGPPRDWNGWTSGLRCDFGAEATGALQNTVVRWVKPTGAKPWEVAGDTPYPDTECQVRRVVFGDKTLAMVSPTYDPDWIYGNQTQRAPFSRLALPKQAPYEASYTVAYLMADTVLEVTPETLAAMAAGRPLALTLRTNRTGNLYVPGEEAAIEVVLRNVTERRQACRLEFEAWSYRGERVLQTNVEVALEADGRRTLEQRVLGVERGIVFLSARLSWDGGEQLQRLTLGFLPERQAHGTRPDSPFALAAVIADPEHYPDQAEAATVLPLAERIGVRWVRSGWVPFKSDITPAEADAVRVRSELFRQHGILPYAQVGAAVPKAEEVEELKARVAATTRLRWGSPYLEVGNELNYSAEPLEYVERMLRPVHEVMRREWPEGRVVSMGLGGVGKDWFAGFTAAGGMAALDVLAVHPGCHPRAPEYYEGWDGWVFRPQMARAMQAARAAGKTVWIDEGYAPAAPARAQLDLRTAADYLLRTYVCALAIGVERIAWYQFQDGIWFARRPDPEDLEYSFGILYTDLSPKPAYIAYGAMTEYLEGAVCEGRLELGAEDLYGFRFRRDGGTTDVLWSYREKHETDLPWWPPERYQADSRRPAEPWVERWRDGVTVTLAAAEAVTVVDLMGNRRAVASAGGSVSLVLTGSPVYVQGLGAVPRRSRVWPEMPETR